MGRAGRARRIAAAAALGGGGLAGLGAAGYGVLAAEARLARRWIGQPFGAGPDCSGWYGADGPLPDDDRAVRTALAALAARTNRAAPAGTRGPAAGPPLQLAMLGDSSAVGLGVDRPEQAPGALLGAGLAEAAGTPVRVDVVARVGAESLHLDSQVDRLVELGVRPRVAVIMIGANDVTHRLKPSAAVAALAAAVRRLRALDAEVVVGTCPDLGTIEPLAQPLRLLARRWSRELAAAQTIAVVEAGGRTVSLGDLLGAEFSARPAEMFSADRFHPSAAGYARAAAAILPSVCAALDLPCSPPPGAPPAQVTGHEAAEMARAAARAAGRPGSEVTASPATPRSGPVTVARRRLPRLRLPRLRAAEPAP